MLKMYKALVQQLNLGTYETFSDLVLIRLHPVHQITAFGAFILLHPLNLLIYYSS
jgi:hypothetical protein